MAHVKKENTLLTNKNIFLFINNESLNFEKIQHNEIEYIINNFCGTTFNNLNDFNKYNCVANYDSEHILYLCGNIKMIYEQTILNSNQIIYVVPDMSYNYLTCNYKCKFIDIGEIPINIYGLGIFFRNFFTTNKNYYNSIQDEHKFNILTESNKPSESYRKGIYITNVEINNNNEIKYNLLRCSTNMNGPTDNFKNTDIEIINKVNNICNYFFEEKVNFNHVLAQTYENIITDHIEKKAKIKEHSDKTKDMPHNGLMAFCTFYKNNFNSSNNFNNFNNFNNVNFCCEDSTNIKKSKNDMFNYCFNGINIFTEIKFKLKKTVINNDTMIKEFNIILYPNSLFIMSLSTNRLYTHEIKPSILPINKIPIRMGYVIRCSKTIAIYKNNKTYLYENENENENNLIELEKVNYINNNEIIKLKNLYYKENTSDEIINYDKIYFSLNNGDYLQPIL